MINRSLHICIVTADFPGLTETFITNKVLELSKRGNTVTVIKNSDAGIINTTHLALIKQAKIEVLKMHDLSTIPAVVSAIVSHPSIFIKSICLSFTSFKRKFKSHLQLQLLNHKPFDLIHFEFSGLAVSYLQSIKKLKTKKVVSCRGTAEKVKPLTDKKRKENLNTIFTYVDAIHCVSVDMANTIVKYGAGVDKIFVNTPAIDTAIFNRAKEYLPNSGSLNILTIGRFTFQKGYLVGLLAIKQLKERGVSFTWQIVGDGPLAEAMIYHIHALELENEVKLLGKKNRDEILGLYNEVDVFLLPSVYEGIANVCLEAMAMELPVVSTKSGGMEEVIIHGENGLLCEIYNPCDIVDKLQNIAMDFSFRKQLGANARQTVLNNFTLKKQVDVFQEQYHLLLNKN
jgi:colanic acid/amylovoran biosynthesis glycosyltransferase